MNLEDIKNNNNFSFVETVADIATNKKFIDGYNDLINGVNNENSYIWNALSAIGQDITSTIYDNVLNYINNVSNIDTCKVKALKSLCKILGIKNYGILQNIENIPIEVIQLIDIFSINKKYLETNDIFKNTIYDELIISSLLKDDKILFQARNNISSVLSIENPENTIKVYPGFNNEVYESFIENMFFNTLSSNLFATYNNKKYSKDDPYFKENPSDLIFKNLESYIAQLNSGEINKTNQDLNLPYRENIESIRSNLNVSLSFNPYLIADKIDAGEDFISNYTGNERYLILLVLDFRKKQKFKRTDLSGVYVTNEPLTQYSFYKEKKFIEYLKFVNLYNNILFSSNERFLDNFETYSLDNNFAEIKDGGIKLEELQNELATDSFNITRSVAKSLKDICFNIVNIRERLKTQCQKNYMRGTFLLISYIINEYLKNTVKFQYLNENLAKNIDRMTRDDIGIQEYDDTTEYFNIKTESSEKALNANKVNLEFWKQSSESVGVGLAISEIDNFYLNTMNLKTSVSDVRDFLDIIYDLGADKSYIDARTSSSIVISEEIDEIKSSDILNSNVEKQYKEISAYQNTMFLKYNGTEIGWNPYFNWKNETHSSYQIHPYLYNFIEHNNSYTSTIKNAFYNDANENLISVLLSPQISTHIGEVGNILNIWKDDIIEYSGYRSRYEINSQSEDNGQINLAEYYDGIFYPEAIKEFALSAESDILFEELIFCIKNRLTGEDVFNGIYKSNNFLIIENESKFYQSPFRLFIIEYEKQLKLLELQINSNVFSENEIDKLKNDFENFKKTMPKTFYDKWFHFANLSKKDAEQLAENLSKYKKDILELLSSNNDIYKFTLDKFGNNIFLYKDYGSNKNPTFKEKLETPGKIWFKKAGFPIGFPIDFDKNDSSSLIKFKNSYLLDKLDFNIYDLEQTRDYKYLLLIAGKTYETSEIIIYTPEIYSEFDTDNKGEIKTEYSWNAFNNKAEFTHIKSQRNFKFSGIFQSGNLDVVITYTSCDFENNKINIEEFLFPENTFTQNNLYDIDIFTDISSNNNDKYKVSFANNKYGIVWLSELEREPFVGSNYIGVNTKISKDATTLNTIRSNYYGEFYDLTSYTIAEDGEYNSFDIFDTYITFLEFNRNTFEKSLKYYNLNSDASYIPLYSGNNGFIRIWANEYFNKKDIKSIELLGLSFNKISELETEFCKNMYEDSDGNFTADDPSEFVETISRVFENYEQNISSSFKTFYNPVLKLNKEGFYEWSETLMSAINETNIDLYNCFLYNMERGVTSPIFSGTLTNISHSYISSMTNTDEYYWKNGTINLNYEPEVYGTPNIFKFSLTNDEGITTNAFLNTNSIFGISNVNASYDPESRKFKMEFYPIQKDNDIISGDIIIDANKLALIINKNTLDQFSDYHFMTHHNIFPYSSEYDSYEFLDLELSSYNSFNDSQISGMFKTGNVAFKINEESDINNTIYPNTILNDTLNDIFKTNSTSYVQLSNIFSTKNTYILELEKPKTIADIIGEIKMNIYGNSEPSFRVTEEYLTKIYTTSRYEDNILKYVFGFDSADNTDNSSTIKVDLGTNISKIEKTISYTVTEEDIKDFLKLYVNFSKDETDEITLYFNYNNLFCSPYLYHRDNGKFSTVFKQNTYKKIKPGEETILDIVVQIKYHNYFGEVCGIKDIPILAYKIYNVSDDKPKFIIKSMWTLNHENSDFIVETPIENNNAKLYIDTVEKDFSNIDGLLNDNFTLTKDIVVLAPVYIQSNTNSFIKSSSCDLLFEFTNKDIEFLESMSLGAGFVKRNGVIHAVSYNNSFKLAFKIKKGTYVNENGVYTISLDAINFKAINNLDVDINNLEIIPGAIIVKFVKSENSTILANWLGQDDNSGFIKNEFDKLIQIFRNKTITVSETSEGK